MRWFAAVIIVLGLGGFSASSQVAGVSVEVVLEQGQFLPGEQVKTAVRITNLSSQPLPLGREKDWLIFYVDGREGNIVAKLGEVPVDGEYVLQSRLVGTKRVDLAPYFDLAKPGRYTVTAVLKLPQWESVVSSVPKSFEVINGTRLREVEFGVPPKPGQTGGSPELRRYVLQEANYLKQITLYFRLTDASGSRTLAVFPLGPLISYGSPETQLDRAGNFHVLHQIGMKNFNYCKIDPDGKILLRQTHEYFQAGRPSLRLGQDGDIVISGGKRSVAANDIPPADEASSAVAPDPVQAKP